MNKIHVTTSDGKLLGITDKPVTPAHYIQNLIDQLENDIFPVLCRGQDDPTISSDAFTVLRNVFCFIDHVSSLLFRHKRYKKRRGGYRNITQTEYMILSLNSFMKEDIYINSKYREYSSYLVQIYRHDLVHHVHPLPHFIWVRNIGERKNTRKRKVSGFVVYNKKPKRLSDKIGDLIDDFKSRRNRNNLCHLRYMHNSIVINSYCIFFDCVNYLLYVRDQLKANAIKREKLLENYSNIVNYKKYMNINGFVLDKYKNRRCKFFYEYLKKQR